MKNWLELRMRSYACGSAMAVALLLGGAPALAQESPAKEADKPASPAETAAAPDDSSVGDIVVTANRREQRTQSVGIAVSAYSGETLTRSGINSTIDLGAITPGLAITLVTPGQPALIAIRCTRHLTICGPRWRPMPMSSRSGRISRRSAATSSSAGSRTRSRLGPASAGSSGRSRNCSRVGSVPAAGRGASTGPTRRRAGGSRGS